MMHPFWIFDQSSLLLARDRPLCYLVFDKNVDGLVHYLEILSDDIFYYSWQKLVMAEGQGFINISPYTKTDSNTAQQ